MGDNVKIDRDVFHKRLGELASQWKNDKRQGGASFAGAGAIVCLMGKNEDAGGFHKNGALQVCFIRVNTLAPLLLTCEVLAAGIRIPRDPDGLHARSPPHNHNKKERYAIQSSARFSET